MADDGMAEAPRPDPGFRALVVRDGAHVDVTDAVMDVYDIAVNSMDFGSGFLSTEEVGNLRALGKAIGADRFDYQHDKCLRCGQDRELHSGPQKTVEPGAWRHGTNCPGYLAPA